MAPINAVDMSVLFSPPRRRLAVLALGFATLAPSESRKPAPAEADRGFDFGFLDWFDAEITECTPVFPRALFFPLAAAAGLFCFMYSSCAWIKAGIDSVAALDAARLDLREEEAAAVPLVAPLLESLEAEAFPFRFVSAFLALLPAENSTCIRSWLETNWEMGVDVSDGMGFGGKPARRLWIPSPNSLEVLSYNS